jgi:putative FmdB family regulatory protein
MPLYAYRCDACGHDTDSMRRADTFRCGNCGASARRRWHFQQGPPAFEGHYNTAAGRYVSSEGELRSAFAEASDQQSKLTGQTVDIQPVDYRDAAQCGITEADIDRLKEEKAKVAS